MKIRKQHDSLDQLAFPKADLTAHDLAAGVPAQVGPQGGVEVFDGNKPLQQRGQEICQPAEGNEAAFRKSA